MNRPKIFPLALGLLLLAAIALLSLRMKDNPAVPPTTAGATQEQKPSTQARQSNVPAPMPAAANVPSAHPLLTEEVSGAPQGGRGAAQIPAQPAPAVSVLPPSPAPSATEHPYVIRARPTQLSLSALPSKAASPGRTDRLPLFADVAPTVEWEKMVVHASNNYAWYGSLAEDPLSAVTLTRVGDYTIIEVQSPKFGQYEVHAEDGKPGKVRQLDSDRINQGCKTSVVTAGFGSNSAPEATNEAVAASGVVAAAVTGVTIDVLMVYTAKARELSGSRSAIVAKAQSAVNGENGNFTRSGVAHTMRLVQTREVTHTASGNLGTELGWVAGNSTVASIRSEVGADIVAFLSDKDDTGTYGIAYQLTSTGGNSGQAFSANYYDTVSGVWPHEVGHNLGCQHNSAGVYSYSSGHYWTDSSNGVQYGSVMSYIGSRIPYFSNPDVTYSGEVTGTSSRNNALSINNIGDNVAGYKGSKTVVEPSCVVTTSTIKPNEGVDFTLTIKTVNGGPSIAAACQIGVTLPSQLALISHNGGTAFNTTTKVWDVPDLADGASATLVLTVRPNAGSTGISMTPSAQINSVGSGVIDFDVYNNSSSVTLVPVPVATTDLVLHYALDEASGKTAADASNTDGIQNAATTYATPLWQPAGGMIGGALRFTPTAQADVAQAFSYNSAVPIISGYPFTMALWVRATPGTWYQVCAMLGDQTTGGMYFELSMNSSRASAMARNTSNSGVSATSPSTLPVADDAWHHLAGVFTSAASRTLYVDGVAVATNTTSVPFVPNNKRFSIGALMRDVPTQSFPGYLDDMGLWNTALSPQRVALIHALGRQSRVDLDDPAIGTLLVVNTSQSGFARAGDLVWVPATGLSGAIGATGIRNGQPYLVLNGSGGGLVALTRPVLTVQSPSSDTVSLYWHSGFSDWILQESSDLSPTGWVDSTEPVADDGLQRSATYPSSDTDRRFFRLRKP